VQNNDNINNNLPINNNYQQQISYSNSINTPGSSQKQMYPMDNIQNNFQQNMNITQQNQISPNVQQNYIENHSNRRQDGQSLNQLKSNKRNFQATNNNYVPLNDENQNVPYGSHSPNKVSIVDFHNSKNML